MRCVEKVWWRENKGEMCGRSVINNAAAVDCFTLSLVGIVKPLISKLSTAQHCMKDRSLLVG